VHDFDRDRLVSTPPPGRNSLASLDRRILPGTSAQLDQDLAARLIALSLPENTHDECLEPLGASAIEAALWLVLAALLWVIAAIWSLRT
jgi:hypothetical protein